MIVGIGTDIVELARMEKPGKSESFLKRCYSEKEITLYRGKTKELAGNFAVKEAVAKCFGTGFRGFEPSEIEVLRDELGKPYVNLYKAAKEKGDELGITNIHVSITNEKVYVVAFAVCEHLQ